MGSDEDAMELEFWRRKIKSLRARVRDLKGKIRVIEEGEGERLDLEAVAGFLEKNVKLLKQRLADLELEAGAEARYEAGRADRRRQLLEQGPEKVPVRKAARMMGGRNDGLTN